MDDVKQTQNQQSGADEKGGISSPIGGVGNQNQAQEFDWKSFVSNDPVLSQFQSPEELAKAYLELQKKVGEEKIPKPDLNSEEQLQNVLKELGFPEKPEDYPDVEIDIPGLAPEEMHGLKEIAYELGILPQMYPKFLEGLKEILEMDDQISQAEREEMTREVVSTLQKEWGNDFESKMKHVQRIFRNLPQSLQEKIIEAGLDLDVEFIKFLDKVSQYYKEDTLTYSEFSVNDAKQELQRILSNPNHPYFNKEHPEHEEAVQKVQMLYRIIYGG